MILITGGAGYIGSHTIIQLQLNGYDVAIIDNFSNSSIDTIEKIERITNKKPTIYNGDVRDIELIKSIFRENIITDVIHFAGLKSVSESTINPVEYYEVNFTGTLSLISESLNNNVVNFIFSSSATVYGTPEIIPLTETCRVGHTTNPYGTSKYLTELMLKDVAVVNPGLNITVLRYFNPVGAHHSGLIGESPKGIPNNLVPYLTRVASGELDCLSVFGNDYPTSDGTGVRDFIHVEDLASGHLAALKNRNKSSNFNVYNLGTGKGYTVLEIINKFKEVNGIDIKYKFSQRRNGDIAECWSDPSCAEKELNWKATRTLEDMLRDAWRWQQYSDNTKK